MDYGNALGAEFRAVAERNYDGRPARSVIASRTYATSPDDLWDALTNADRIPRWFAPVSGDLHLGGRYQVEGNAGGQISRCDAPNALDLTWEFGGNISWIELRLEAVVGGTKLTLEHIMPKDAAAEEHWRQYGPGATGVGWDLSFLGLGMHLASGGEAIDSDSNNAWLASKEGIAFMTASATAWGEAHVVCGEDPASATKMAETTIAAYTGS